MKKVKQTQLMMMMLFHYAKKLTQDFGGINTFLVILLHKM